MKVDTGKFYKIHGGPLIWNFSLLYIHSIRLFPHYYTEHRTSVSWETIAKMTSYNDRSGPEAMTRKKHCSKAFIFTMGKETYNPAQPYNELSNLSGQ